MYLHNVNTLISDYATLNMICCDKSTYCIHLYESRTHIMSSNTPSKIACKTTHSNGSGKTFCLNITVDQKSLIGNKHQGIYSDKYRYVHTYIHLCTSFIVIAMNNGD